MNGGFNSASAAMRERRFASPDSSGEKGGARKMSKSTRLAVFADIHGNLPALEAVLADVARFRVDEVVVLGDLADRGPQPLEVIRLMQEIGGLAIRGNTDSRLVQYDSGNAPSSWNVRRQFAALRWTYEQLDREALDYMAALPEQRAARFPGADSIRLVHGTPYDPERGIFPLQNQLTLEKALAYVQEPVMLCAHTHLQWTWEVDNRLACNPGSVGQPFDGGRRARYALLAWDTSAARWEVTQRAVAYAWDETRRAFYESGLVEEGGALARACLAGMEVGRDVVGPFIRHAYGLGIANGYIGCEVLPDHIWEEAEATFEWPLVIQRSGV
jgi:putative phosphoesterase